MLNIIIADAELELIPKELWKDSDIRDYASKRGRPPEELLLDSSLMHRAIDRHFPGESRRRGRPDIFHVLLLVCQESILNKKHGLRVSIHTRDDFFISVNPESRIPRSYNRFIGVIEDLYRKGSIVADGKTLLSLERRKLSDILKQYETVRILSPTGGLSHASQVVSGDGDLTVVIGGFTQGDFRSSMKSLGIQYSIFEEELTIWTVASEIIGSYERSNGMVL